MTRTDAAPPRLAGGATQGQREGCGGAVLGGEQGNELMQDSPERTKLHLQVAAMKAIFGKTHLRETKD